MIYPRICRPRAVGTFTDSTETLILIGRNPGGIEQKNNLIFPRSNRIWHRQGNMSVRANHYGLLYRYHLFSLHEFDGNFNWQITGSNTRTTTAALF
jgi:hypothetical protein